MSRRTSQRSKWNHRFQNPNVDVQERVVDWPLQAPCLKHAHVLLNNEQWFTPRFIAFPFSLSQCNEFDLVECSGRARALAGSSLDIFDQRMSPKRNEQSQTAATLVEKLFLPQKLALPQALRVQARTALAPGNLGVI